MIRPPFTWTPKRGPTARAGLCAAALVLGLLTATPAVSETITTRAGAHSDYGRIVFDWTRPVEYDARIEGGRLIVRFAEPVRTDLSQAMGRLSGYVSGAEISADGQTLSFDLRGDYGLNTFRSGGSRVVIDLLRTQAGRTASQAAARETAPAAPAVAPAAPRAPARPAQAARSAAPVAASGPRVNLRAGDHEGFGRLVFDWPDEVSYRVERQGSTVRVVFDREARIAVERLRNRFPNNVTNVAQRATDTGSVVEIQVGPAATVRDYYSGNRVVIDVLGPESPRTAATETAPSTVDTGRLSPEAQRMITTAPAPAPRPSAATPAAPTQPEGRVPTGTVATSGRAAAPPPAPQQAQAPDSRTETAPPRPSLQPNPGALAELDLGTLNEATRNTRPAPGQPPIISFARGQDGATIGMNWARRTPAAVFEREGYLWMVFAAGHELDLTELGSSRAADFIQEPEQIEAEPSTVIRMRLTEGLKPTVRREFSRWTVFLARETESPEQFLSVQAVDAPGNPYQIDFPQVGPTLLVEDPLRADKLWVTTTLRQGAGIGTEENFEDFDVLPSAQGVVVNPKDDSIFVRTVDSELGEFVLIRRPSGGPGPDEQIGRAGTIQQAARQIDIPTLFPLRRWRQGSDEDYDEIRGELVQELAQAGSAQERNRARLQLAQFFFAHGLGPEALSVIQTMTSGPDADESFLRDRVFVAMRGVAHILANDHDAAEPDLALASLNNEPEAILWRAVLNEHFGRDQEAVMQFEGKVELVPERYAKPVRMKLYTAAAQAAVQAGEGGSAIPYVDALFADNPNKRQSDRGIFYQALAQEQANETPERVERLLETASRSPDRWARSRATLALVERHLNSLDLDLDEAIEMLEQLRLEWRGDIFEFDVLARLGDLYIRAKDYRDGLLNMRRAARGFPNSELGQRVRERMRDVFKDLYLNDRADELSPLTAVALFDEFRELTPVGADGDEMIRKLSERLVGVDLLDRAAKLLEHQVQFRLDGEDRARVGARLAEIRLLDREPELALLALDTTDGPALPPDVNMLRDLRRAEALARLDRPSAALDAIATDLSEDADLLRIGIAWRTDDWDSAAEALQRLLPVQLDKDQWREGEPLSNLASEVILNLSVALLMSDQIDALRDVRAEWERAMIEGPRSGEFRLIASAADDATSFRTLEQGLRDVADFESFILSYRARLETESARTIN